MISRKNLYHRIEWLIRVKAVSPIHIGREKKGDDGTNIYALLDAKEENFVIPGSSLRGVFRSYLDSIIDIFDLKPLNSLLDEVFGYTGNDEKEQSSLRGRALIGDVKVPYKQNLYRKNMTPIGRITHRPNDPLVIYTIKEGTTFSFKLTIDNPQKEEIGLIALFLKALSEEEITIGSGSSRGLGHVKILDINTKVEFYSLSEAPEGKWAGIYEFNKEHWQTEKQLLARVMTLIKNEEKLNWMQYAVDSLQEYVEKGVTS